MSRHDGRAADALRPVRIATGWQKDPLGSALFEAGATRVLCAVSLEEKVPPFLVGRGEGWVTAEYGMLPGSTDTRAPREATRGRQSGRTLEIQRLVGRAMRAVVDRKALGERTLWIDCDVLQADGGTRTASITGGFVALAVALKAMQERGQLGKPPLTGQVAAISVGILDGRPALDLDYAEDSSAEVDMNVVRTDAGLYIELQGTAEKRPFDRKQLDGLLALADAGIDRLLALQREAIGPALDGLLAPPR